MHRTFCHPVAYVLMMTEVQWVENWTQKRKNVSVHVTAILRKIQREVLRKTMEYVNAKNVQMGISNDTTQTSNAPVLVKIKKRR